MKTVFLIVGETASGKDSLTNKICLELNLKQLLSYATRPKRYKTEDTHVFIDTGDVDKYDNIIAYTKIGEYEYFATLSQLEECDIYIIDPNGVGYLKQMITEQEINIRLVTIYIYVREFDRIERALKRSNNNEILQQRIHAERKQFDAFKTEHNYDYSLTNSNFNKSFQVLKNIILTELVDDYV